MIIMMRTTITLPDDIYERVRELAHARRISLGDAVAELVRQNGRGREGFRLEGRLPVAILPEDSPIITSEQVKALLEEEFD